MLSSMFKAGMNASFQIEMPPFPRTLGNVCVVSLGILLSAQHETEQKIVLNLIKGLRNQTALLLQTSLYGDPCLQT